MHADVGYAPAMAMLSAYGFYDGQTRDDPGGRTAVKAGGQAQELLITLKGVVLQELCFFCKQEEKCVTLTILFEGHQQTSGVLRRPSAACGMVCADMQREIRAGLWCLLRGMCLGWAREAAHVRFWAACHEQQERRA